eukprot:6472097-Amphidinium_carterae.1
MGRTGYCDHRHSCRGPASTGSCGEATLVACMQRLQACTIQRGRRRRPWQCSKETYIQNMLLVRSFESRSPLSTRPYTTVHLLHDLHLANCLSRPAISLVPRNMTCMRFRMCNREATFIPEWFANESKTKPQTMTK